MTTRYARRMLSVAAASCLLLAACSGSDEETEATGDATETTAAPTSATTAAGATEEATDDDAAAERPADWPESITFGAVPSEQATKLETSYAVTLDILKSELGVDIEFFQAADYAGIVEAQIAGTVDVAQYGPFSYVIAKNNGADIEVAGVMTDGPDVEPGYRAYGVTQADNADIAAIDDFAGRNVCFVDPGSTSGFLYPSAGLLAVGIDPETGVTGTFAGGHDAAALSVVNGTCEAGFAFDSMITSLLVDQGEIGGVVDATGEGENVNEAEADLKIVWKSPVIAGSPMAISTALPASFIDAFVDVLNTKVNEDWATENGFCTPGECRFSDEEIWGYVTKDDTFFDGVREVCEQTQSPACQG